MNAEAASGIPTVPNGRWLEQLEELGPVFAERAAAHDKDARFVAENFTDLKKRRFFSFGVPAELGGGGASHSELCGVLRQLARYCGSTALTASMHMHLIAANVWKYRRDQPGEKVLRKVAQEELVLVSTGGRDWLSSSGEMTKAQGGYRVNARKAFSSGCEYGDVLVTSARLEGPSRGAQVLHFSLPLSTEGIELQNDWFTLGMRGTGSRTVALDGVFVPDEAVVLARPADVWHPVWAVVAGVALPLIMAVYVGVAEQAAELALSLARHKRASDELAYLAGELENELTVARLALDGMISLANDYRFEPTQELASEMLVRKTICTGSVMAVAGKALELAGGVGFFQGVGLERLVRDLHAAQFHPLPAKQQHRFTGRLALGLEAVG
ncbi:MAG TPA: acyl-CoA dehydrogenase family protein [Trueperaceae bacterium]